MNSHLAEQTPLVNGRQTSASPADMPVIRIGLRTTLAPVALFIAVIASLDTFFVVPPGTIGVVTTFGKVDSYTSGAHMKSPFVSTLINFTAKTQKLEEENDIPTKEGLNVRLDTAM